MLNFISRQFQYEIVRFQNADNNSFPPMWIKTEVILKMIKRIIQKKKTNNAWKKILSILTLV